MNHRAIWLTAAVLAGVVLLAQIAGAATREETASVATNATVSAELATNVATVALPEQASSLAREKAAKDATSDRERAETDENGGTWSPVVRTLSCERPTIPASVSPSSGAKAAT